MTYHANIEKTLGFRWVKTKLLNMLNKQNNEFFPMYYNMNWMFKLIWFLALF